MERLKPAKHRSSTGLHTTKLMLVRERDESMK
ncbi:uncharacterized protein G2W53_031740 [Senna tora]|uniref:Uncharacterized protein n=1 Tax=Senna tora TaxID=362788 RepID=A0A834T6J3_9FABA|nr:uncharacterized protein G2W53_031740 [Senna tora]